MPDWPGLSRDAPWGQGDVGAVYPGVVLAQLLPLLAVGLAQLLLVPDEQAQLVQGSHGQGLCMAPQDLAQRLCLARQCPARLQGGSG